MLKKLQTAKKKINKKYNKKQEKFLKIGRKTHHFEFFSKKISFLLRTNVTSRRTFVRLRDSVCTFCSFFTYPLKRAVKKRCFLTA